MLGLYNWLRFLTVKVQWLSMEIVIPWILSRLDIGPVDDPASGLDAAWGIQAKLA